MSEINNIIPSLNAQKKIPNLFKSNAFEHHQCRTPKLEIHLIVMVFHLPHVARHTKMQPSCKIASRSACKRARDAATMHGDSGASSAEGSSASAALDGASTCSGAGSCAGAGSRGAKWPQWSVIRSISWCNKGSSVSQHQGSCSQYSRVHPNKTKLEFCFNKPGSDEMVYM